MELEYLAGLLKQNHENCIREYHRGHLKSRDRMEVWILVLHTGGIVPEEIVIKSEVFLKIKNILCVAETWGDSYIGGCTWRLKQLNQ